MTSALHTSDGARKIVAGSGLVIQVRPTGPIDPGKPAEADQIELMSFNDVNGGALLHSIEVLWTQPTTLTERRFTLFLNVRLYDRQPRPLLDQGMLRRLWAAGRVDALDDHFLDSTGQWCVWVNVASRETVFERLVFTVTSHPLPPYLQVELDQDASC